MMKRKLLVPMVALLLSVGMIGVGFAAWMISNVDEHTDNYGDFIVHTVENNSITLTIDMTDNKINFGPKENASGDWLTFNGDAVEDLSATLRFKINEWESLNQKKITVNVHDFKIINAPNFGGMDANGVSDGQYITLPEDQEITIEPAGTDNWTIKVGTQVLSGAVFEKQNDGVYFMIPLNFGWGSQVEGENPITYYKEMENNPVNRGKAADFLSEIHDLNGAKYQFTVTAKVG